MHILQKQIITIIQILTITKKISSVDEKNPDLIQMEIDQFLQLFAIKLIEKHFKL